MNKFSTLTKTRLGCPPLAEYGTTMHAVQSKYQLIWFSNPLNICRMRNSVDPESQEGQSCIKTQHRSICHPTVLPKDNSFIEQAGGSEVQERTVHTTPAWSY